MSIKNRIVDVLMILSATVATMSIVGDITLNYIHLPARFNWLIYTIGCYLLRFGSSLPNFKYFSNNILVVLFFTLIFWEGFQGILLGRNIGFTFLVHGFTYIVFYAYFIKSIKTNNGVETIIKPYCLYYIVSVIVIFLSVILLVSGILSLTDNPITENSLMNNNIENLGTYYYWPGHLSIVSLSTRIELFENTPLPLFCGFSHEPHVLAHSIYPAFMLLYYFVRNKSYIFKIALIASIVMLQLVSFSTTSLVSLCLVFLLDYFTNFQNKSLIRKIIPLLFLLLLLILSIRFGIYEQIFTNSANKILNDAGGSKSYTLDLILYGLSPQSILGEGIYLKKETIENFSSGNVGLISCILVNITYIVFTIQSFKNFRSNNALCHFIGMATLYFAFHSLKLGCLIYNYPMMFYMIFLLTYSNKVKKSSILNNIN